MNLPTSLFLIAILIAGSVSDTLAGFLMVSLRRIPRRTDHVQWQGWRFEVMDVDNNRVDQVMISRLVETK